MQNYCENKRGKLKVIIIVNQTTALLGSPSGFILYPFYIVHSYGSSQIL